MIVGILGPEGGGKSCLMAWFLRAHYKSGGKVLTFPGYDLYKTRRTENGKTPELASESVPIESWVNLSPELSNVAIGIDELQNFFHSYTHNTVANRLFSMGIAGQRRKRNLAVIYTMQLSRELPQTIRERTHLFIYCWDTYWRSKMDDGFTDDNVATERGRMVEVRPYDNLGHLSGMPGQPLQPWIFLAHKLWPYYDSYAVVDVWNAFAKIKVKGREIELDEGGRVIEKVGESAIRGRLETLLDVTKGETLTMNEILSMTNLEKKHQTQVGKILKDMGCSKYMEGGVGIYEMA